MAYNPFIKLKQSKVDKIPWITGSYTYCYSSPSSKHNVMNRGIVYQVSDETIIKIRDILSGKGNNTIQPKDKVFLMPGSKIPLFKLKEHIKSIGASHVSDIDKATFFIGTDAIYGSAVRGNIQPSQIITTISSPTIITDFDKFIDIFPNITLIDSLSYKSLGGYNETIIKDRYHDCECCESRDRKYLITPAALNIMYNIIAKKLPVVNEGVILNQITPSVIVDEGVYEGIVSMFSSSDSSNYDVARELLANCDISKSIFYIWKLSKQFSYQLYNSRMKNIKLFVERSAWKKLYSMSEEEFIEYMYENDYLTKEFYIELVKMAAKKYENTLKSPVFKMKIEPSDKYKEYVGDEDLVFEFHHVNEESTTKILIPEENETFS